MTEIYIIVYSLKMQSETSDQREERHLKQIFNGCLTNKDQALFEIKCKDKSSVYIGTHEAVILFDLIRDHIIDTSTYSIKLKIGISSELVGLICSFLLRTSLMDGVTSIIPTELRKNGVGAVVLTCNQIIEFIDYMGLVKEGKSMKKLVRYMGYDIASIYKIEGMSGKAERYLINNAVERYCDYCSTNVDDLKCLLRHIQCGIFDYFPTFSLAKRILRDTLWAERYTDEEDSFILKMVSKLSDVNISFVCDGQRQPVILYMHTDILQLNHINMEGIPFIQTRPEMKPILPDLPCFNK